MTLFLDSPLNHNLRVITGNVTCHKNSFSRREWETQSDYTWWACRYMIKCVNHNHKRLEFSVLPIVLLHTFYMPPGADVLCMSVLYLSRVSTPKSYVTKNQWSFYPLHTSPSMLIIFETRHQAIKKYLKWCVLVHFLLALCNFWSILRYFCLCW